MRRTSLGACVLGAALFACAPTDDAVSSDPAALATGAVPSDLQADSRSPVWMTWDARGARPKIIAGEFPTAGATVEDAARAFLARHARRLGVDPGGRDLAPAVIRRGLAATYVRFQQVVGNVPVFDRQVIVAVAHDRATVRAVNLGQHGPIAVPLVTADRGPIAAIAAARARLGAVVEESAPTALRGLEVTDRARLAYRVTIVTSAPPATWQVSVDAATGDILSVRDRNVYVDGSGLVFDMTPVASSGSQALVDGNDNASAALDAARFTVTLPGLDGTGVLRGPWVDAMPSNPNNRANQPGLTFAYDRRDDHFEEVMAYYHLDRAQTRIQALGFTDVNHRVQVARVNATTADNSFYSPANKEIRYGSGGVDDAEDADIVLHEYGHSIHDNQVPGWGGGDESSMGEGFGDYLAASFSETLPLAAGHPQAFGQAPCVGEWDAVSYDNHTPKCLRRTDSTKHAPEHTVGEVHDDGEIWSAGLWRARAAVGADVMDRLVLESHFLLSTSETFNDGAVAVVVADLMLFNGSHEAAVRRALYHHGLLRVPRPAATYSAIVASADVLLENTHDGNGFYPNDLDEVRTYSRPGSLALRVHFANIDLMPAGECDGSSCDNLYVTDGAGDLFQILTAADNGPRMSVQVPGDTIAIRLITDGAGQGPGYVIDRVEAMGGIEETDAATDAPIDARPIDAGIDAATDAAIDAAVDAAIDGPAIDAAPEVDAAPATDAASPDAGQPGKSDDDGGCCSTGTSPASAPLALLVGALLLRPRRRR